MSYRDYIGIRFSTFLLSPSKLVKGRFLFLRSFSSVGFIGSRYCLGLRHLRFHGETVGAACSRVSIVYSKDCLVMSPRPPELKYIWRPRKHRGGLLFSKQDFDVPRLWVDESALCITLEGLGFRVLDPTPTLQIPTS